jgi:DNA-binding HxlR family transcriptional regulator
MRLNFTPRNSRIKNIDTRVVAGSVGRVLVSPSKIGILLEAGEHKGVRFNELLRELKQTPGNLNYHLLTLLKDGLVQKTSDGEYVLSTAGDEALKIIKEVAKA